tara:strand:+ start:865 stop:1176 length:312 start_codon:yes stop_codon:yes gene_type:complete
MKLDHIAINVKNVSNSVKWYQENYNARIKYADETWASLLIGDVNLALTVSKQHPPHLAFTLLKMSDFPKGREIKYHRDGSAYLYTQDPDGNTIEYIYWPGVKE